MERSHGGERGSNGGERRGWRIQERMALELPWSKGKENKRQLSSDIIDKRWPTLEGGDMRGEEEEKRRRRGGEEEEKRRMVLLHTKVRTEIMAESDSPWFVDNGDIKLLVVYPCVLTVWIPAQSLDNHITVWC